jgi:NADPH-dependent glutamate synthase beta subunit-like oxidoreductase
MLASGRAVLRFEGGDSELRVRRISDSPCRVACPAGVNVKAYVGLVGAGEFDLALEVVRARNPLPGICGRVCTHPCEAECRRQEVDAPVAIRPLKRFIADLALKSAPASLPADTPRRNQRVAIVGSGPAGLTAANDLARLGYQVTIFEAGTSPGGMMVLGIPPFRLPRDVISQEVESITSLGVRLETGARIDAPLELLDRDFSAVFYAVGAHRSIELGLPRENETPGIVGSLTFLRQAYCGERRGSLGTVLVVGGGNSAIDSARTAKRLGAREVKIVYRRTRREMPAAPEEVAEAEAEGVKPLFRVQPVDLLLTGRRLKGLRCIRNRMGAPDASGRRRPEPVPGSEFDISANLVVSAVGQQPETGALAGHNITLGRSGTIAADPLTCGTGVAGLFAGGDVVTGPSTVVDAIAAGHRAASGIHAFLTGEQGLAPGRVAVNTGELELQASTLFAVHQDRVRPPQVRSRHAKRFAEVELSLSDSEAVAEAKRCLHCGPCSECVQCHGYCPKHQVAISLPGSDEEVQLRLAGLESVFPDAGTGRSVVVSKAGARSVAALAVPVVCIVGQALCRDCGQCVKACVHHAITSAPWRADLKAAKVDHLLCRGCGHCLAVCPSGALSLGCPVPVAGRGNSD